WRGAGIHTPENPLNWAGGQRLVSWGRPPERPEAGYGRPAKTKRGAEMGHVEAAHLTHTLPDGRVLLDDVSFRVGDGLVAALVGPNGAGKTTLMRLVTGDLTAQSGTISSSGGLGVMRQFVGGIRDDSTVRDLLLSVSPQRVRDAAARLDEIELLMMERDDEPTQMRYARAL